MTRVLLAAVAAVIVASAGPSSADSRRFQVKWKPDTYRVHCAHPQCLPRNVQARAERLFKKATRAISALNFLAPKALGERIDPGGANDHIRIYDSPDPGRIAAAGPKCFGTNKSDLITIGKLTLSYMSREYLQYYFMAHELFHVSQYAYPIYDSAKCTAPGWVMESTADAVALDLTRKAYPNAFPARRDPKEAHKFAGVRRYDVPLPSRYSEYTKNGANIEIGSGLKQYYNVSSFWRHIANAHHKGSYAYLDRYLKTPPPQGDYVKWLAKVIKADTAAHLGIAFAGFLADYAGWGDKGARGKGYPGQFYGRERWLNEVFGGCQKVTVRPDDPAAIVDVELRPIAGECIEVRVAGVQPEDRTAVQVAAVVEGGDKDKRNEIHLSLAEATDKRHLHCAKWIKDKGRVGLASCVLVPDDGQVMIEGSKKHARVWNVLPQDGEADKPPAERQSIRRGGGFTNLYTVSRTPVHPSSKDTIEGGKPPAKVRFYFVIDVAELEVKGNNVASKGTGGVKKRRAVASLNSENVSETQETLPKQGANGAPIVPFSVPDPLRPTMPMVPAMGGPLQALGENKLVSVTLSAANFTEQHPYRESLVGAVDTYQMMPVEKNAKGKYEPRPLNLGETGSFPIHFTGGVGDQMIASPAPGSLTVSQFTDLVFRASFSGVVCRLADMRENGRCSNPIPVSGRIVKAFAGARLTGQAMVVEDTPGMKLYRDVKTPFLPTIFGGGGQDPAGSGGSASGGGGSKGAARGGTAAGCDCSCAAFEGMMKMGKSLKKGADRPTPKTIRHMQKVAACAQSCAVPWSQCKQAR